jgi:hypothetical protein
MPETNSMKRHKFHNFKSVASESELHRPSDRPFSAKLMPTLADGWCHVVSVTNPYGRNLEFLDRSRYCFFEVAPQLYSGGRVDPVHKLYHSTLFSAEAKHTRSFTPVPRASSLSAETHLPFWREVRHFLLSVCLLLCYCSCLFSQTASVV